MPANLKPSLPKVLLLLMVLSSGAGASAQGVWWLTDPDKTARFEKQKTALLFSSAAREGPAIDVNEAQTFQTIDGFGCCLTGGRAVNVIRMETAKRAALLKELFATDDANIGISYLRVSIGASDLNDRVFSYDDLPPGQTDPGMARFSLAPDRADVIPVLKEILAINPDIKILGSPWSPPPWMKTNHATR